MVALRTLQLKEGREDESRSTALAFSESQQQRLKHLAPKLQGPTHKQQNPYSPDSPDSLPWAS